MSNSRTLLNDCFLHDKDRMKHADVLATIAKNVSLVVDDETIALDDAAGRICAKDVRAQRNVPLTNNTAVDGYAFAHADYLATNGTFELGALIAAGEPHTIALKPGQCARIFTGAKMPENAETVAMQEDCTIDDNGIIHVPAALKLGANCRLVGEDLAKDDVVLKTGERITPARIAALASIGCAEIDVRKKLRVAIFSTGNEILEAGSKITESQVFDANRPMLKALLDYECISISDFGILKDQEDEIRKTLSKAAENHDLILTSGGASRGDEDHMLNALDHLGKRHLWQIAIKPGRPMMMGQIGNCAVVGLPGNPVAAMVCTMLYALPIAEKLIGALPATPQPMFVPAGFEIKKKKTDRREFLRGWLETGEYGQQHVIKFPRDGSGLISGLRAATGLIEIAEEIDHISTGDAVRFIPFSTFGLGR